MSTAKNALYAAVGVGGYAVEKARSLPQRATEFPGEVASRAGALRNVSLEPSKVRKFVDDTVKSARKQTGTARKRTTKFYGQLTKRGEKVVKQVQRSAPFKRAVAQTKQARSRVKGAATSIRKAAKADTQAAKSAVEAVVEQTG